MTGLQLGCARADCCQRRPPSEEDDLEAVAGRVVRDMATLNVEDLPVEGADPYGVRAYSDNLATAIAKALQEALPEPDHDVRVFWHTYTTMDNYWVGRYRVVRNPKSPVTPTEAVVADSATRRHVLRHPESPVTPTVLSFVVGGGLCVVTDRHGSWIVPSPQRGASGTTPWMEEVER